MDGAAGSIPTGVGLLFDTSDLPARWHCGDWSPLHGWFHIASDLAIASAYAVIPVALAGYWWVKRGELAFPRLFWFFAAFIFSCGATHAVDALIFYHPVYRVSALMKTITAVASWSTVIALWGVAPRAIRLPGLERANATLAEQLEKTRRAEAALERSNCDLEAFTGLVTHDLRNPLHSAMFAAQLAREASSRGDAAMASERLDTALSSLRQMEALIRELHADAMLRSSSFEMSMTALGEVVASARINLAPLIAESGADLDVTPLPEVFGSRTMLVQLFINLIENAIKYAGEGRPRIRVEGEKQADGRVTLRILDQGLGIASEDLETVFHSGVRGENARHLPGSGLGLAFVRRIMEAHGGTIIARPSRGGAVFELTFPAPAAG
jgi:chemotaxis family two-component system sensor kinase Cph1